MTNAILSAALNGFAVSVPLAVAVWIALRVSRRWLNAATRYGVWWVTLLAVVVMPLLYLPVRPARWLPIAPVIRISTVVVKKAIGAPLPAARGPQAQPPAPVHAGRMWPVTLRPGVWSARFAQLWALAAMLMGVRLVVSYAMLHRRKMRATDAGDRWATFVETSLARLGTRRRVRVAVVDDAVSPMVAGPFRPSILLPSPLLAAMQDAEIEQICLHEAAHVARYDDWALLAQRLIETLFVLHPLVRWISTQIHLEREIACDDVVISTTGLARPYAACLTHAAELAGGFSPSPVAAAATDERSHLAKRVEMLLDRRRHRGARLLGKRFAVLTACVVLVGFDSAKTPALFAFAAPQKTAPDTVTPSYKNAPPPAPVTIAQVRQRPAAPSPPPGVPAMSVVHVTVTDPYNHFVTGLNRDAFQVFEDGVEQKIVRFASGEEPASLAIVWGFQESPESIQSAPSRSPLELSTKIRLAMDVYKAVREQRIKLQTANVTLTLPANAAGDVVPIAGKQSLLDGIHEGIARLARSGNNRSGLVIIYDAADTTAPWPENEIHETVREAGMPVYTIGVTDPDGSKGAAGFSPATALLGLIANATAGLEYSRVPPVDVPRLVEQIGVVVANEYVLGYIPSGPTDIGKYRKLDVRLTPPRGLPQLSAWFPAGRYGSAR